MGGHGSGFNGTSKQTVDDGLTLSVTALYRMGILRPRRFWSGAISWPDPYTGETTSKIGVSIITRSDGGTANLSFRNTVTEVTTDQSIELVTTPVPWKGLRRWWFICRLTSDGRYCGRRVGRLYLPNGARYFGCRHCYRLTYTSCQRSHKNDAFFRRLGAPLGLSARQVAKIF